MFRVAVYIDEIGLAEENNLCIETKLFAMANNFVCAEKVKDLN